MKKTITLTDEQSVDLSLYLAMTTKYRKREREAWEELAAKKNPDGTLKFPNAPDNAAFWAQMEQSINVIRKIIDDAPLLDN